MTVLRPITPDDHAWILDLNAEFVHLLAPLDEAHLTEVLGYADRAAVIEHNSDSAGFVITIRPGTAYDSVNYLWFADSYDIFGYLDRIVLAPAYRRLGLGARVYDEIETASAPLGRLALEVNIDPPNEPSLAFHRQRGYRQVGEQHANGHLVGLMTKELR